MRKGREKKQKLLDLKIYIYIYSSNALAVLSRSSSVTMYVNSMEWGKV